MPGVSTATIRPHDRVQGASVNAQHGKTGPSELSKTRVSKSGDEGRKRGETHNGKVSTSDAAVIPEVKVAHEDIRNREPNVHSKASPQSQSDPLYSAQESDGANTPEPQRKPFVVFGIEARYTHARLNEICRNYLNHRCFYGRLCHRVHPVDHFYYRELLHRRSDNSPVEAESDSVSEHGHTIGYVGASSDGPTGPRVKFPASEPRRAPEWDSNTGQWVAGLNNAAWNDSGNSSDEGGPDSSFFSSPRTGFFSPSLAGDETVVRKTRPRTTERCKAWLHGRCFWRYSCNYVHEDLEYDDEPEPLGLSTSRVDESRRQLPHHAHGVVSGVVSSSSARPPGFGGVPLKQEVPVDRSSPSVPPGLGVKPSKCNVRRCESSNPPEKPPGLDPKPPKREALKQDPKLFVSLGENTARSKYGSDRHTRSELAPPGLGATPHPPEIPFESDSEPLKREVPRNESKLATHSGKDPARLKFDSDRTTRSEVCRKWRSGQCSRDQCRYLHEEIDFHDKANQTMAGHASSSNRPTGPRSFDVCWDWTSGGCPRGSRCHYVHVDFKQKDLVEQQPKTAPQKEARAGVIPESTRPPFHAVTKVPELFSFTFHKHIKVNFGAGFEVQDLVTGFETFWVYIGNVPKRVTEGDIIRLLRPHGEVAAVRMKPDLLTQAMTVKARFSSAAGASRASSVLNGTQAFGVTLRVRLAVNNSDGTSSIPRDTAVRIQWEAPGKVGYGGYPSIERAREAIEATRDLPYGDSYTKATIHLELPAVGVATVKFHSLPVDATEEGMEWFAQTKDVMWERPNYTSLPSAISGIRGLLLESDVDLLEFHVLPPPYKDGMVRAWAHFSTPGEAKAVCDHLHKRKPWFTGHTKIYARHLQSVSYYVSHETFNVVEPDILALGQSAWRRGTGSSVSAVKKPVSVSVKICGEDLKELGRLKLELDKILTGVIVQHDGKVVWDDFFARSAGVLFLLDLEREHRPLTITKERSRRTIRLLGSAKLREIVHKKIVQKAAELRCQQTFIIPLDGRLVGLFMSEDLIRLQENLGLDNVVLDLGNRRLKIRGDQEAFDRAREAVNRARSRHSGERQTTGAECPVCFEAATSPLTLHCGHRWCRACITQYLTAAVDQNFFPLTCLGNEAHCPERIPLGLAKEVLPADDFEAVLNAAFSAHIHTRPNEFHFCPTPDCNQVYRSAPEGTVLQCPSCLLRICPNCHSEAHDGLACAEVDGGEVLFKEWMKKNDVKSCPGCNIPIEHAEGCNHMMCTQCQTHICWVCMQTFPKGEGIYGHMRQVHGGFGLGPID